MPQVVINLTEEQRVKLVTALCANYGYATQVFAEDGTLVANPVTPGEFAQQKLVDWGVGEVESYESRLAHGTATQQVEAAVAALREGVSVETVEDE